MPYCNIEPIENWLWIIAASRALINVSPCADTTCPEQERMHRIIVHGRRWPRKHHHQGLIDIELIGTDCYWFWPVCCRMMCYWLIGNVCTFILLLSCSLLLVARLVGQSEIGTSKCWLRAKSPKLIKVECVHRRLVWLGSHDLNALSLAWTHRSNRTNCCFRFMRTPSLSFPCDSQPEKNINIQVNWIKCENKWTSQLVCVDTDLLGTTIINTCHRAAALALGIANANDAQL